MKLLAANITLLNALPSVIWHGMGDTANSAGWFETDFWPSFDEHDRISIYVYLKPKNRHETYETDDHRQY